MYVKFHWLKQSIKLGISGQKDVSQKHILKSFVLFQKYSYTHGYKTYTIISLY